MRCRKFAKGKHQLPITSGRATGATWIDSFFFIQDSFSADLMRCRKIAKGKEAGGEEEEEEEEFFNHYKNGKERDLIKDLKR